MCGISAIFLHQADPSPQAGDEIQRIIGVMVRRGPDGEGTWQSACGRLLLGHRRLAIIDTGATGHQPMECDDLVIAYNGEIYNYRKLRQELTEAGHAFHTGSDTEVILVGYRHWGEAILPRLRGMFAFALWDSRRQGLLLARDPYGIKPLYVADQGGVLRAASQVRALVAGGGLRLTPSPAGHAGFFLWGHVPEPFTLYREIRSLAPGGAMWTETGGRRREWRFADAIDAFRLQKSASGDEGAADSTHALREALRDSVRHHLVADVPVGLFLSSGIDSTALAVLAAEADTAPLRTITLAFREYRGTPSDEAPGAETVARLLGTEHTTVELGRADFEDHRERLLAAMDQPTVDGVNVYFVSLAAARAGLKVALSGLGGDELFGGYSTFRRVPRLVRWGRWAPSGPGLGRSIRQALAGAPGQRRLHPKWAALLEFGDSVPRAYLLSRCLFLPWEIPGLLEPEFAAAGLAELETEAQLAATLDGIGDPFRQVAALESRWYMRNQLLRDADWAGMAHSLEIRVPLVDLWLARKVMTQRPPNRYLRKPEMIRALPRPLPLEITRRPKTGFQVPVRQWLMPGGKSAPEPSLRAWARDLYAFFGSD